VCFVVTAVLNLNGVQTAAAGPSLASRPIYAFVHGSLTLEVIGVDGAHLVFAEVFPLAFSRPARLTRNRRASFSTDGFGDPNGLLSFVLADGKIHVEVLPLFLDCMTTRSSTAEVTYETAAVPEPASAVLLLSGLSAAGRAGIAHDLRE